MSHEYNNPTVGGPACGYATLGGYNQGYGAGAIAPVPSGVPSMAVQIVPNYSAPGYDALTHGLNVPSCSGYFGIGKAYPSYSNNCTRFTTRLCGGQ